MPASSLHPRFRGAPRDDGASREDGTHADAALAVEAEILRRARTGERGACRALVERHRRRVFGRLSAILGPVGRTALVEDLAQETFLRAFRALDRFELRGPASMRTWLATIATRVALNELRRRPLGDVELDTVAERFVAPTQSPARTTADAIARAVASLSPTYRGAFLLREVEGLDYAEIAEVLQVDLGTVKSRLSRARANLRRALAEVSDD